MLITNSFSNDYQHFYYFYVCISVSFFPDLLYSFCHGSE